MTKLNQIVAIEKGEKAKATRFETDLYRDVQKLPLLTGIARTYQPKDDQGDVLPAEQTLVQLNAEDVLQRLGEGLTRVFDVVFTKEATNAEARADVVVDGLTILSDVPVTYLLFLEKRLTDLRTFIEKIPTLDPSFQWVYDPNVNANVTAPVTTTRTQKVPRNHVKAPATDKHPAQVDVYYEDVIVGFWQTVRMSGSLPAARVVVLLERVDALLRAVKFAREGANDVEVIDRRAGEAVFDFLFGPSVVVTTTQIAV